MFFTSSTYFFLLGSLLFLALIYLWRRHAGTLQVPDFFLWEQPETQPKTGNQFSWHRLPPLFWLESGILLALVLAAAMPFLLLKKHYPPLVVILDNSMSMSAIQPDGKDCRKRLLKIAQKAQKEFPGRPTSWLLADASVHRLQPNTQEDLLRLWTCNAPEADIPLAITHAQSLAPQADFLILTDHAPDFTLPPNTAWHSQATPVPNLALTNLRRNDRKILVETSNFSSLPCEAMLKITGFPTQKISFSPGEHKKLDFLLPDQNAMLPAEIRLEAKQDSIQADSCGILLPELRPPLRFTLHTNLSNTQRNLLLYSLPRVKLYQLASPVELVFTAPTEDSPRYHRVVWHASGKHVISSAPVTTCSGYEEIMRGLNWEHLRWPAGTACKLPGTLLAFQGSLHLLSVQKRGDFFDIHINLAPNGGQLPSYPFWPELLWNIANFLQNNRPGPENPNLTPEQTLQVHFPLQTHQIQLILQDGTARNIPVSGGNTLLTGLAPGKHKLTTGGQSWDIAVNAIAPLESDLTNCAPCQFSADTSHQSQLHKQQLPLAFLFLLAAILLLVLHQFILARQP